MIHNFTLNNIPTSQRIAVDKNKEKLSLSKPPEQ
jgi:hypothetical protein